MSAPAAAWFTKERTLAVAKKYNPQGRPFAHELTAALDAMKRGSYDTCWRRCDAIEATHGPQPWTQMLRVLIAKDRLGERARALEGMRYIVQTWPGWDDAQYNLGAFLQEMGEWAEGLHHLRRCLSITPDHVPAMVQIGICHAALGDPDAADRMWDEALRYKPRTIRDEYHLSPIFAARGDFYQFMRLQELRWEAQEHYQFDHGAPEHVVVNAEMWRGEDLTGHDLLILDEQGAGDTLQFARYLPMVQAQAKSVWLRLKQPHLRRVLEAIAPGVHIVMAGEPLPFCSRVVGLMSLFHRLAIVQRTQTPFPQHYLPLPKKNGGGGVFGICWAGAPSHPRDAQRSMTPTLARTIIDGLPGRTWVDLTVGRDRPDWPDVAPLPTGDYLDTAHVMAGLAGVVTVDTSVAHLAGAMGIPCWVLVTTLPDMRWGLRGNRTPWYDSWTIVRQARPNDWTVPIARVLAECAV